VPTTPDPHAILATPMPPNDSGATTIGGYLTALLAELWREADGFSGKHPFGTDDWQHDVYAALTAAGHLPAARDRWGELDIDHRAADALILSAINTLAAPSAAATGGPDARRAVFTPPRQPAPSGTTPPSTGMVPALALRIQLLRERMDQAREQIVLLSLQSIALEVKAAFPAAAQVAVEITEEWPHGLEPGDLFDREGTCIAPLPPRDEATWKTWSELADRIRTDCNALDETNKNTWGFFCRPKPGMPPAHLRLNLDDALAIRISPRRV
jgi:hypothetical protein